MRIITARILYADGCQPTNNRGRLSSFHQVSSMLNTSTSNENLIVYQHFYCVRRCYFHKHWCPHWTRIDFL